jgi:hypothetical protein
LPNLCEVHEKLGVGGRSLGVHNSKILVERVELDVFSREKSLPRWFCSLNLLVVEGLLSPLEILLELQKTVGGIQLTLGS